MLETLFPEYKIDLVALRQRERQQERLDELFQKAGNKIQERQFFSPENDSAEYYYMEVLMMAPESVVAQQGLVDMAELAIADAKKSLAEGDLAAAQTVVTRLLAIDPNHIASLELQKKINAAEQLASAKPTGESSASSVAADKSGSAKSKEGKATPEVVRLVVAAEPIENVPDQQQPVLSARRTLYAGVAYQAFSPKNTLVNAVLYGPEGQAQANVPITIDQSQGKYFFRIDHRKAFASGDYELKIVWDGHTLQTTRFKVR